MATDRVVGLVSGLWRFPVKSMKGERLQQADLSEMGIVGDRAYGLIDVETGKVVSAKSVKLFPDILKCGAAFTEQPRSDSEAPPVVITFPDGSTATSDSEDIDDALSAFFRREVRLAQDAPDNFTIDHYLPELQELGPTRYREKSIESKLGSALFAEAGLESPVPVGSFFDVFPVSVLTTSTLEQLNELRPESRFDERRFRMNLIVDTEDPGFIENGWIGHQLAIGDVARLRVIVPDSRCVMITLAQDELAKDSDVLRTLARHNRIEAGGSLSPCAGAYAVVLVPGTMRLKDPVTLK